MSERREAEVWAVVDDAGLVYVDSKAECVAFMRESRVDTDRLARFVEHDPRADAIVRAARRVTDAFAFRIPTKTR